jgi:adenylate cyclase, class 2
MKPRPALETEVKLRVPALAPLRPKLAALGFTERIPQQLEQSVLWDRGTELFERGSALRLRTFAGKAVLTFKGPKQPHPELKIRPEIETEIADADAAARILEALGYAPVQRMEKSRSVWERKELEACLDEAPFGCFLELEGEPAAIRLAMEGLGLGADRIEPRSYPTLFHDAGLG